MLTNVSGLHAVVILVLLALEIVALVQVWRDPRRTQLVKVLWTAVIIALAVVGVLGWVVNWVLGKAADALQRRNA
ncbi:hypothetical protein [Curtobacterium sp. VKM Ac-1376]|uniref:hypothetical protein n=1 Tax=Curtobacterium sp. VKM Ac-1376 TaxID=123312 RepID=UPI00188BCF5A|nr:hypothetical protein [Curtobacterium sp. VKM Ac-1376]MBF4616151.1 hypothetical protein [Curtobacterium sp. VKM Ac-1376]